MWHKAASERCCGGIQHRQPKGTAKHHQQHQQQQQQQQESSDCEKATREQQHLDTLSQRYNGTAGNTTHALNGDEQHPERGVLPRTTACPVQHVAPAYRWWFQQESLSAHGAIARYNGSASHQLRQHNKKHNEDQDEATHQERIQLQQHFYATCPPGNSAWRGNSRWGGDRQQRARGREAPIFTVEEGFGSTRSNPRHVMIGGRRANLPRRIVEAMREFTTARRLEQELPAAQSSPVSQHHRSATLPASGPVPPPPPVEGLSPFYTGSSSSTRFSQRPQHDESFHTTNERSPQISDKEVPPRLLLTTCLPPYRGEHIQPLDNHSSAPRISEEQGGVLFPIHPRQAIRTSNAFHAVFEALMTLLPAASGLGRIGGGGGRGGEGGAATNDAAVDVMKVATLRCGNQCREHIRSLQRGFEVVRTGETGVDIRCKLTLQGASGVDSKHNYDDGAILALHDLSPSRPLTTETAKYTTSSRTSDGGSSPSDEAQNSIAFFLRLADIFQVQCNTSKTNNAVNQRRSKTKNRGEVFSFVLLAHGSCTASPGWEREAQEVCSRRKGQRRQTYVNNPHESDFCDGGRPKRQEASGKRCPRGLRNDRGHLLRHQQVEPFGVLKAGSDEQLSAIVLGVTSVMSALDSPFTARQQDGATAAATSTPAAACLPWQGARVCIAALAPQRTLIGAVIMVEDEAERASSRNGIVLRDRSRLLICTDRGY